MASVSKIDKLLSYISCQIKHFFDYHFEILYEMLNFLLFIFFTSIIGILVICFFFLNTDIEKEQQERAKREAAEVQKQESLKSEGVENITYKSNVQKDNVSPKNEIEVKDSEKEKVLVEQIKQLEKNLCEKDTKIKCLQEELQQQKFNSQEQIKKKIDEVITNFEPKIRELINKSEEKVDRLLAINEELYENTRRQAQQESEMLNMRNHMVDKMDQVMRALEKSSYVTPCKAKESDDNTDVSSYFPAD